MNYILILVLMTQGHDAPVATSSVKFSSLAACRAAATEVKRQLSTSMVSVSAALCAQEA